MSFEKVLNGLLHYLNAEVYSKMNSWQEVLARIAVSRMIGNAEELKKTLMTNPFLKTIDVVDAHGNVDVDGLMRDLRKQIEEKGRLVIEIPILGNFTFTAEDVDELHRHIREA